MLDFQASHVWFPEGKYRLFSGYFYSHISVVTIIGLVFTQVILADSSNDFDGVGVLVGGLEH